MRAQSLKTGRIVKLQEDVISFRGERGHLVRCDAVNIPGKDGKVTVMVDGHLHYNYAGVWGLRVVEDGK